MVPLFFSGALLTPADVTLPAIFSTHAVLQKSEKVPIWGKAAPNESVTVTLDQATATATAGADGKWQVVLDLKNEGPGPFNLTAKGSNLVTVSDVLVGEVWLCSGQSNMYFPLNQSKNAAAEIAQSANPMLREFTVAEAAVPAPADEAKGQWVASSPQTSGGFTAVGYFFGKRLQQELKVPIGLIHSSRGGSPVEAWTSADALAADPDLKAGMEKAQADFTGYQNANAQYLAWEQKYQRQDHPLPASLDPFTSPTAPTTDWTPLKLPGSFSAAGVPEAGAIWLRRKITIPPDFAAHHGWPLYVADFKDPVVIYLDGKKVAAGDANGNGLPVSIAAPELHPGESTLAIRIFSPTGDPDKIHFAKKDTIPLDGDWLAKAEFTLPPLDGDAKTTLPVLVPPPKRALPHFIASYLFNGMINPLIPYALAGTIWYQGESNSGGGLQYRTSFPMMIKDWRQRWGQGDFPFYFCQLANIEDYQRIPGDSKLAELREAQTMTLSLPNTGQAILIDIGESTHAAVHPTDKLDVGNRLALIALAKTYGKQIAYSGPMYDSMAVEGDKIRIKFKFTDGGLVAKPIPATYQPLSSKPDTKPLARNVPDSQLEGFAICGDDHKWTWANASIDGTDVVVSSAQVPKPVAVRYAWADNPLCNLYNGAGLPACPFRTDSFPGISLDKY
jgi:sialate O-acetylesterase